MCFVWHTQVETISTGLSSLERAPVHYCFACFQGRVCFLNAFTSANTITGRCHLSLAGHGNLSRIFPHISYICSRVVSYIVSYIFPQRFSYMCSYIYIYVCVPIYVPMHFPIYVPICFHVYVPLCFPIYVLIYFPLYSPKYIISWMYFLYL